MTPKALEDEPIFSLDDCSGITFPGGLGIMRLMMMYEELDRLCPNPQTTPNVIESCPSHVLP